MSEEKELDPEHLELVRDGAGRIAEWREANPETQLDLERANLGGADLRRADLAGADLWGADLRDANLAGADLRRADLAGADLWGADLRRANLAGADLGGADLRGANLAGADLRDANLAGADLGGADLAGANLGRGKFGWVAVGNVDLSKTIGLEEVVHVGPSTLGTDTLIRSGGKIPTEFLKGCGLPDSMIDYLPSLIGAEKPAVEFYSCFISYNQDDEGFAKRLHGRLDQERVRCWFAPEDLKIGDRFHGEIDSAIRVMDKLLLVLSDSSIKSKWVAREVERALTAEERDGKPKLFPIRLCDVDTISSWESESSKHVDLAEEVRLRHIGDFSDWKNQDSFETAFARLLRDLEQEGDCEG